jgi:hypothetical protein
MCNLSCITTKAEPGPKAPERLEDLRRFHAFAKVGTDMPLRYD